MQVRLGKSGVSRFGRRIRAAISRLFPAVDQAEHVFGVLFFFCEDFLHPAAPCRIVLARYRMISA
jgi:hypothetical protein